ncbi:MAG: Uma2 family endonuclease [Cyanobacteria bacterium RI_101]|nr:Uma2 family endonuclease [Cyanobacteria bacterium RI_101]
MTALTARELERQMPDATQLWSDEPEMESSLHYLQLALLVASLEWLWRDRQDFFIGANLTIYFSRQQLKNRDFRGPDFFLVKNTARKPRRSWVVWEEEGRYPDLIIELLSESTSAVDRREKRDLYGRVFHTPEYFYFSPETLEFAGFKLHLGQYEAIEPNAQGWLWSEELGLFLGVWGQELRYFSLDGTLIPSPTEAAEAERQNAALERQRVETLRELVERERLRANEEQQKAEQERLRANQMEAQLRAIQRRLEALGSDPEA